MNREFFHSKVKVYTNKAGQSQEILANLLGLSPFTLNHKLAGRKKLATTEIKQVVKILVEWEAITRQSELEELLGSYDLKLNIFRETELNSLPFNRLEKEEISTTLRHNLPSQINTFIGREREVKLIHNSLLQDDIRLVTLTGTGGIGKTRLAIQVAETLLDNFKDGIYFVPLAALSTSDLVGSVIRQVLDLEEQKGKAVEVTVKEWLRNKNILLVIDNFEHLLDATSMLMDLLASAPFLKLLVTSRARLRAYGEYDFAVTLLPLPDPERLPNNIELISDFAGIKLFIDRAQAVNSQFTLSHESATIVADICNRLDGLPLAIELAAARLKLFSLEALQKQLSLKLLTTVSRTLPPRHQSLHEAITWSFDLLSETEKSLFVRLAVFVGNFSIEAVESICTDNLTLSSNILENLSNLVDYSFLSPASAGKPEDKPRFTMLETLREYAVDQQKITGEYLLLQQKYSEYYLTLAQRAGLELMGANQHVWLSCLELELDNLRVAIGWSLNYGGNSKALKTIDSIWRFWWLHGHLKEGRYWLEEAIKVNTSNDREIDKGLLAKAYITTGIMAWSQGDYYHAAKNYNESLIFSKSLDDKSLMSKALVNLGVVSLDQGDPKTARQNFIAGLQLGREVEDKQLIYVALGNLGILATDSNDYDEAQKYYEESLTVSTVLGDKWGAATTYGNLGELLYASGNYSGAKLLQEKSLSLHQEIGDKRGIAMALDNLGKISQTSGNQSQALVLFKEEALIWKQLGVNPTISSCLAGVGSVLIEQEKPEQAVQLFGAVEAFCQFYKTPLPPIDRVKFEHYKNLAQKQLSELVFNENWAKGKLLSTTEALNYALKI